MGVAPVAVSASTAGTKWHVACAGRPEQEKSTAPTNPDQEVTVTEVEPGLFADEVMLEAPIVRAKVGGVMRTAVGDDAEVK